MHMQDKRLAAGRFCSLICSKEICHFITTEFETSGSLRRSPPSLIKRDIWLNSLQQNRSRYLEIVILGAFTVIYTAAWVMASGMYFSAVINVLLSFLSDWSLLASSWVKVGHLLLPWGESWGYDHPCQQDEMQCFCFGCYQNRTLCVLRQITWQVCCMLHLSFSLRHLGGIWIKESGCIISIVHNHQPVSTIISYKPPENNIQYIFLGAVNSWSFASSAISW